MCKIIKLWAMPLTVYHCCVDHILHILKLTRRYYNVYVCGVHPFSSVGSELYVYLYTCKGVMPRMYLWKEIPCRKHKCCDWYSSPSSFRPQSSSDQNEMKSFSVLLEENYLCHFANTSKSRKHSYQFDNTFKYKIVLVATVRDYWSYWSKVVPCYIG